jgi:hypothetical protein
MSHANARLTVHGRMLLMQRILAGQRPADAAPAARVLIGQPPVQIGQSDPSEPVSRFGPQLATAGRGPRALVPARARVRLVPPDGVGHPKWQQGVAPLSASR